MHCRYIDHRIQRQLQLTTNTSNYGKYMAALKRCVHTATHTHTHLQAIQSQKRIQNRSTSGCMCKVLIHIISLLLTSFCATSEWLGVCVCVCSFTVVLLGCDPFWRFIPCTFSASIILCHHITSTTAILRVCACAHPHPTIFVCCFFHISNRRKELKVRQK